MKKLNPFFALLAVSLLSISSHAQAAAHAPLEEYFFQSGKIKVVITVAGIVMIGLFIFLFMIERRVSKLEKNNKN
ncbi:MAG: CcmD family protein [Flavobacteriales bacterium]|jgi:hypothetical protein